MFSQLAFVCLPLNSPGDFVFWVLLLLLEYWVYPCVKVMHRQFSPKVFSQWFFGTSGRAYCGAHCGGLKLSSGPLRTRTSCSFGCVVAEAPPDNGFMLYLFVACPFIQMLLLFVLFDAFSDTVVVFVCIWTANSCVMPLLGQEGAILVFLPGWDNISNLNNLLMAQQMFRSGKHLVTCMLAWKRKFFTLKVLLYFNLCLLLYLDVFNIGICNICRSWHLKILFSHLGFSVPYLNLCLTHLLTTWFLNRVSLEANSGPIEILEKCSK